LPVGSDIGLDVKLLGGTPEMCKIMEDMEEKKKSRQQTKLMDDLHSIRGRVTEVRFSY
jgi:hypothetical protein